MFIIGNLISAIANILDVVLTIFYWLILIRAVISWVNPDPLNLIVQFLYRATDPILNLIRRTFRLENMGIDLSPIIAFLLILFARWFVVKTLLEIAAKIR